MSFLKGAAITSGVIGAFTAAGAGVDSLLKLNEVSGPAHGAAIGGLMVSSLVGVMATAGEGTSRALKGSFTVSAALLLSSIFTGAHDQQKYAEERKAASIEAAQNDNSNSGMKIYVDQKGEMQAILIPVGPG